MYSQCKCVAIFLILCLVGDSAVVAADEPVLVPTAAASVLDLERIQRRAASLPDLHSLLISQHGEIVHEAYFNGRDRNRPANTKSASKSIISAIVGIAIERGYVDGVDQPIADFFPELNGGDVAEGKQQITVGNLLSMQAGLASTSGRNYGGWVLSDNWVQAALDRPLVAEPGTDMIYSTGSTHLLSAIIERASGMNTREFTQHYLASPMNFRLAYWSRDPQGIYFGGNDMEITPRHMLAFGQLYLDGGRFRDRQVLPADWIQESFQPRVHSPRGQGRYYGYGWALRDIAGLQVPLAWGFGGQMIFVVRELDMVVVMTSNSNPRKDRFRHLSRLYDLVEHEIVGNMVSPIAEHRPVITHAASSVSQEK